MSLNISSETIGNPLLIDLLRQLNRTFLKIGSVFFVIGATARDIILSVLANTSARRKTRDLDIAIVVTDWDKHNEICQALIADGFEKSTYQTQRFYFGDSKRRRRHCPFRIMTRQMITMPSLRASLKFYSVGILLTT